MMLIEEICYIMDNYQNREIDVVMRKIKNNIFLKLKEKNNT